MDRLTPRARAVLGDYLDEVGALLVGGDLDAGEVREDIRDHVLAATADLEAPVDAEVVAGVLQELGPPSRWVDGGDGTGLGQPSEEKWPNRMAAMSVAVLVATVVGLAVFPWVGPLALLVAWALARATVAYAGSSGRPLGPLTWLVYPPLVLFTVAVLVLVLVGPVGVLAEAPLPLPRWMILAGGLSLWYGAVALLCHLFPPIPRLVLFPIWPSRWGDRT